MHNLINWIIFQTFYEVSLDKHSLDNMVAAYVFPYLNSVAIYGVNIVGRCYNCV